MMSVAELASQARGVAVAGNFTRVLHGSSIRNSISSRLLLQHLATTSKCDSEMAVSSGGLMPNKLPGPCFCQRPFSSKHQKHKH